MAAVLDLSKVAFNEDALKNGRWVDLSEGGEVCVSRWSNPKFRALQTKLYQEFRRPRHGKAHIKGNNIPGEVQEEINFELVIKTVLLDWRGFANGATEFPCTEENKRALLGQEKYRWIFDEIAQAAMDEEAYRQESLEEDVGNLQAA